jgi:hypothetical protein
MASLPLRSSRPTFSSDLPRIIRLFGEFLQLLVVELALDDGLLEDGGIRGHAQDPIVRHPLKVSVLDVVARERVHPNALPYLPQLL